MKAFYAVTALAIGLIVPNLAHAVSLCPAYGGASDCNIVLTIGPGGTLNTSAGASINSTYDGSEDVLIGVVNNSGVSISSINLSSPGIDIFGFDGDGIDTYGAPSNSSDSSGYGGPISYFSGISPDASSGTVNFLGGLASGGFTYFSLEEAINYTQITGTTGPSAVPEPSTIMMLGSGMIGLAGAVRRKFAK